MGVQAPYMQISFDRALEMDSEDLDYALEELAKLREEFRAALKKA